MLRTALVRVADHAEQALVLRHAVDGELRVEDLVAAVLGVGLGEHHQLHVGGVAAQAVEGGDEVVDLVLGQGQAPVGVGALQRRTAAAQHVHALHGRGLQFGEQGVGLFARGHHGFGHAVVQQAGHGPALLGRERGLAAQQPRFEGDAVFDQALHPVDHQAAVARDVGGLGGPGRDGAQAGHDEQRGGAVGFEPEVGRFGRLAVGEQLAQAALGGAVGGGVEGHQVHEARAQADDAVMDGGEAGKKLLDSEVADGVTAIKSAQVQGHGGA